MTDAPRSAPEGWYPDPDGPPDRLRWWDGERWTEHRRTDESAPFAPPVAPPPVLAAAPGEPAAFALPAAGWWRRVAATLLDNLIVLGAAAAGGLLVLLVTGSESDAYGTGWVLAVAGALFYPPTFLARNRGRTLGKQAVGVRVVGRDAAAPGFGLAFVRETVVKGIFGILWLPLLLDCLMPLVDRRNRAVHDIMLATRVVADDGRRAGAGAR
jgi:uncharacterized RDD family membrane protein YckC